MGASATTMRARAAATTWRLQQHGLRCRLLSAKSGGQSKGGAAPTPPRPKPATPQNTPAPAASSTSGGDSRSGSSSGGGGSEGTDSRSTITAGLALAALASGAYYTFGAPSQMALPKGPPPRVNATSEEGAFKVKEEADSGERQTEILVDPAAATETNTAASVKADPPAKVAETLRLATKDARTNHLETQEVEEPMTKQQQLAAAEEPRVQQPKGSPRKLSSNATEAANVPTEEELLTHAQASLAQQADVASLLNEVLSGQKGSPPSNDPKLEIALMSSGYEEVNTPTERTEKSGSSVDLLSVYAAIQTAREQQATVDREKMDTALTAMQSEFAKEIESLAATVAADEKLVTALREQLEQQQKLFEETLEAVSQKSKKELEDAETHFLAEKESILQQAQNRVAETIAQERELAERRGNMEREQRIEALDKVRENVNVLSLAFDKRQGDGSSIRQAGQLTCAALSLANALRLGAPFETTKEVLSNAKHPDELLMAVVESLPSNAKKVSLSLAVLFSIDI